MKPIRVLDLSRVLAGPFATQLLAEQGADVIKVEAPGGDDTRGYGPVIDGVSTYFLAANRHKRSVVLDLHTDAGREVLERLLAWADVLVENFRPGVAARLGFGWERVHAAYPRLVYVAVRGFGEDAAPEVTSRPGYDLVLQALGGAMSFTGHPGGPPTKHGNSSADLVAGMLAAQAALTGLLHRERGGQGQRLVVNMLQAQAMMLAYHATRYAGTGEVEEARGNAHRGLVPYDVYPCSDGWFALGCGSDVIWQRLRRVLGVDDKPEWRQNVGRVADRAAVDAVVAGWLALRTRAEADALLAAADVPAGPVLTLDQTLAHPAVALTELAHPVLGRLAVPAPAFRSVESPTEAGIPPGLGEDAREICEGLGYSEAELSELRARGAFGGV